MQCPKIEFISTKAPKIVSPSGSYDDDDYPVRTYYGSPLTTVYSSREHLCGVKSAPPKTIRMAPTIGEMPRIRKAPALEDLDGADWLSTDTLTELSTGFNNLTAPLHDDDDNDESYNEDDDTLYYMPGLDGLYSPNEWLSLTTESPCATPPHHLGNLRRVALLLNEESLLAEKKSDKVDIESSFSGVTSEYGWDFENGPTSDDSPRLRDKP